MNGATPSRREVTARMRHGFARIGWLSAAAAVAVAAGAVVLAVLDRHGTSDFEVGVLVLGAFVSGATATNFLGAPFARPGKPSLAKIVFLYFAGAAGVVLTVAVHAVVAIGVVQVSYVTVAVTMSRWPPSEWLARPASERLWRAPVGFIVAVPAPMWAFFAVTVAGFELTGSSALRYAITFLAGAAMFAWWIRIVLAYAGRGPMRRVLIVKRLHETLVRTASEVAADARSLHERIAELDAGRPVGQQELEELSSRSADLAARLDDLASQEPLSPAV